MPGKRANLILIPVVVILLPLAYSVISSQLKPEPDSSGPFLEMPGPEHEQCVRETTYMRYHHWELLRRTREEVVRYGIRGDVSFSKCKECHTSREKFCNRCHDAVSMTPDCFGCHYYP
jgi:hypothetical protein